MGFVPKEPLESIPIPGQHGKGPPEIIQTSLPMVLLRNWIQRGKADFSNVHKQTSCTAETRNLDSYPSRIVPSTQ